MAAQIESFATLPLQQVIPSYLFLEYSDDQDLQAFVASFNSLAQGYLDWFRNTPLGLYTSPNITGPLLDWILRDSAPRSIHADEFHDCRIQHCGIQHCSVQRARVLVVGHSIHCVGRYLQARNDVESVPRRRAGFHDGMA
jgi:hypothetical protein